MTKLIDTRVEHDRTENNPANPIDLTVAFSTTDGEVELVLFDDGFASVEIGFEEATAEEAAEVINAVASSEHMPAEAVEMAFEILNEAEYINDDPADDEDDEDDEVDAAEDGRIEFWGDDDRPVYVVRDDNGGFVTWTDAEPLTVLDDGTEIYRGDRIGCTGTGYLITGITDEGILKKTDVTDDWGVTPEKVMTDLGRNGFVNREVA